ncbi:MAG: PTS transporter subunit EIIC [Oenococcus sp.]|uniref:PTS transporter subunit EIIC n=1 Tax=Oenococcus sp. TaxID=1979414 RepID=UPI0039EC52A4
MAAFRFDHSSGCCKMKETLAALLTQLEHWQNAMNKVSFFAAFYAALKKMLPFVVVTVFFHLFVSIFLTQPGFFLTVFNIKLPAFLQAPAIELSQLDFYLTRLLLPLFAFFYAEHLMEPLDHDNRHDLIPLVNFIVTFLLFSNDFLFQASGQNLLVVAAVTFVLTRCMQLLIRHPSTFNRQLLIMFCLLCLVSAALAAAYLLKNHQFAQTVNLGQWFNDRFVYLLSTNFAGVLLLAITASLFLWLGLPVPLALTRNTFSLPAAIGNLNASLDNKVSTVPNVLSLHTLYDAFAVFGGVSMSFALILLLLLKGRAQSKKMAKIALLPSLFNSNQILAFALPIFFNPLLLLPAVLAPLAAVSISAIALKMNLVNPAVYQLPQRTPSLFVAFLSSGADWRNLLLVVINLAVGMLIYFPFVNRWLERDRDEKD